MDKGKQVQFIFDMLHDMFIADRRRGNWRGPAELIIICIRLVHKGSGLQRQLVSLVYINVVPNLYQCTTTQHFENVLFDPLFNVFFHDVVKTR